MPESKKSGTTRFYVSYDALPDDNHSYSTYEDAIRAAQRRAIATDHFEANWAELYNILEVASKGEVIGCPHTKPASMPGTYDGNSPHWKVPPFKAGNKVRVVKTSTKGGMSSLHLGSIHTVKRVYWEDHLPPGQFFVELESRLVGYKPEHFELVPKEEPGPNGEAQGAIKGLRKKLLEVIDELHDLEASIT